MKFLLNIWLKYLIFFEKRRFIAYKSIDFLPVWNFYQVLETNELRYLLRLPNYELLPKIHFTLFVEWDAIMKQYFELDFGVKYLKWITYRRGIIEIKNKIIYITNSIVVLSVVRNAELIEGIRSLGIPFDDSTEENYYESVLNLSSQLKGYKKFLQIKQREFENEFSQGGKKSDIYTIVHCLEQFKGFPINIESVTVRKFLTYQKEYYKAASQAKLQNINKLSAKSIHNG